MAMVSTSSSLIVYVDNNVEKARRVKGTGWSKEEDDVLRKLVAAHGTTSWSLISRSIPGRSGKSCRLRWCNQISPDIEHRPFTAEEDQVVVEGQCELGNRWAAIARRLPGRTENSVKNRWHCSLKLKYSSENHGVAKMIEPIQSRMPLPTFSPKRKYPEDPADTAGDVTAITQPPLKKMHLNDSLSSRISTDTGCSKETMSAVPAQSFATDADYPVSTILSLALPGHRATPPGDRAQVTYRPPVVMKSPVEDKMSVMENKIQELSRELSDTRKLLLLCELQQQNRSVEIFGKLVHQGKLIGDQKQLKL